MVLPFIHSFGAIWRFRGYQPQSVTPLTLFRWLRQFPAGDRMEIARLLDYIVFYREDEVRRDLVELNRGLLEKLASAGVANRQIIYVEIDEPGSSSGAMLHMLRDTMLLQNLGVHFLNYRDLRGLSDKTGRLKSGAIIYIDDFSGSGDQLVDSRKFATEFIQGDFSEFFLVPYVCQEALHRIQRLGVECVTKHVHRPEERPLHETSNLLPSETRHRLIEISGEVRSYAVLGHERLASMVVVYSNCPDTVPVILRGSEAQRPYKGLFPRTTDF
jgi:hypothetical protein